MLLYLWLPWLRSQESLNPARIRAILSNLRTNWTTSHQDSSAFDHLDTLGVNRALKALAPTLVETRALAKAKDERVILPLTHGMLASMRDTHFLEPLKTRHLASSLDTMMGFMAAILQEETGQRGANWLQTPAHQAVLTKDVWFQLGAGTPDVHGMYAMTMTLRGTLDPFEPNLVHLIEVQFDFFETKNRRSVLKLCIRERNDLESIILDNQVVVHLGHDL